MTAPNKQYGKTADQWDRMCTSKQRYSDEYSARGSAQYSLRQSQDQNFTRLWVYRCPGCRGWHMTKSPNDSDPVTRDELFSEYMPMEL